MEFEQYWTIYGTAAYGRASKGDADNARLSPGELEKRLNKVLDLKQVYRPETHKLLCLVFSACLHGDDYCILAQEFLRKAGFRNLDVAGFSEPSAETVR
jgi:hypothetical protein